MPPFAGYARVSRVGDRAERLISPELQATRIRSYADARGLEVEMLDPELDVSGGKADRPILSEVLRGVAEGRYAGVIVAQLDRLSRLSLIDALNVIRQVEDAGGQLIAVAENFDAGTPEGRMSRNVMLSLGEMQLERHRQGFREAKRQAVERGIWPAPKIPKGYALGEDRRLSPGPEAATVRRAFEARAAARPWRVVAEILDVGSSGAAKIIRNTVYLGEITLGEWVNRSAHEAIVPRSLWEAAQLAHPRPPRGVHPRALLTGLARCAACGYSMTPSSSRKGRGIERIYRCTPHNKRGRSCEAPAIIGQAKLDRYVEAFALGVIERLGVTRSERNEILERAMSELDAAEGELEAFQVTVRVTDIGQAAFGAGLRTRADAVETARRRVAEARLQAAPVPGPETLGEEWPELGVEERGHVLRGALAAVVVAKGTDSCEERVRFVTIGFPVGVVDLEGNSGVAKAEHL